MLGRRVAIGSSILALAVVGGGGAFAATHGDSKPAQPRPQQVVRKHQTTKPGVRLRSEHHCSHSANAAANL
jgi:hypothetical protein